jgi:hypothetical protein
MAFVDSAALAGQPARSAVREMRRAGLRPKVVWVTGESMPSGAIVAVFPEGQLPDGAEVTVEAVAPPAGPKAEGPPGGRLPLSRVAPAEPAHPV